MTEKIKPGYLRVTECLSKYNSFDSIPPQVLQNACDRGTKVHAYAQLHAEGTYFPEPDGDIALYVSCFTDWFDAVVGEIVGLEMRLYDDDLRLTGAVDAVIKFKGTDELVLVDYKTSASVSKGWALQTAAYAHLLELNGIKVARRLCLQLNKDGRAAKVKEYTNYEQDLKLYKAALQLHRFFEK